MYFHFIVTAFAASALLASASADARQKAGNVAGDYCVIKGPIADINGLEVDQIQAACNTSIGGYTATCPAGMNSCTVSFLGKPPLQGTVTINQKGKTVNSKAIVGARHPSE